MTDKVEDVDYLQVQINLDAMKLESNTLKRLNGKKETLTAADLCVFLAFYLIGQKHTHIHAMSNHAIVSNWESPDNITKFW